MNNESGLLIKLREDKPGTPSMNQDPKGDDDPTLKLIKDFNRT
jgi:hypothetical protein